MALVSVIWYILNVCVFGLVISAQCSRDMDYPLWDVHVSEIKNVSSLNTSLLI